MNNKIYFTPGPSELYPTVPAHLAAAMANKIGSISHRSQQFKDIYAHAVNGLRQLLQLPENWDILFVSSANEVWERAIQNNVEQESFHLVNGSFSKRFYEIALELGRKALKHEVSFGQGFPIDEIDFPATTELVAVVQNETSSGVSTPVPDINQLRAKLNPDALIYVDAVSTAPYPDFNFNQIDSIYFSVQKGFGLPAGLGIWLVNDRCVSKAETLKSKGFSIGSYHSIPVLLSKARAYQNPETPNVLAIYLLGKVVEEMNYHGITNIRQETEAKAKLIYDYIANSQNFSAAVTESSNQSQTTIVVNTQISSAEVIKKLAPFDMVVGSGYGSYKDTQIRIANFPAHSLAQVQALVYKLQELFK